MAGIPQKYDKRLRNVLGYRAVWEPGASIALGDVVTMRKSLFNDVATLADWGITFRKKKRKAARLTLNAQSG